MQAERPKQYLSLHNRYLIDHTLDVILTYPKFSQTVLVLSKEDSYWPGSAYASADSIIYVEGGSERSYSVLNGLKALSGLAQEDDWVLVHDVARPCLRHSDIDKLLQGVGSASGAILASPVRDTMKRGLSCNGTWQVQKTVERDQLWHALTPQIFRYQALLDALEQGLKQGVHITDEASAMEAQGHAVNLVEGRADNIKVTRPEDLALAELFLTLE